MYDGEPIGFDITVANNLIHSYILLFPCPSVAVANLRVSVRVAMCVFLE